MSVNMSMKVTSTEGLYDLLQACIQAFMHAHTRV